MAATNSTATTSGRSGGVGASADSYIGSLISLTSKSEIRYEGILYNINTEESSIGLRNVRTYGTEGRKKDGPQVPPSDRIYEYILFRGSDIKDLQVKASPPVQTAPTINNDPAIIQSHYPRETITPSTTLPTAPIGSLSNPASLSMQTGIPGSTFQSGLPLYQPGGSLNSWGPPQQNANGGSLPMSMYWQGFYGTPNVVPQLPQQSLLRPPPGPPIPPMQQMQFPGFNSFLPTTSSNLPSSNLPSSNLPDIHPSMVPKGVNSSSLTTTSLPLPTFSLNVPPLMLGSIASETMTNILPNRDPISTVPTSTLGSNMPSQGHLSTSVPDNVGVSLVTSRPSPIAGPTALPMQNVSQPGASFSGSSNPILTETVTPSLITPGQLLHPGPATISATQPLRTMQKDVEGVNVSSKTSSGPAAQLVAEEQPPILPLPSNTRALKPNGTAYHMRNSHRGFGGRESGVLHPVTKFTEDFDFTAMNEKFKKDEVWGDLGRSNKSVNEGVDKQDDIQDEDYTKLPKPVYNKDDFFDTLSCNSLDNDPNHGRTRYSEQKKLDTETFGDISRYNRGGRGYRGGRFRGSYRGRGFGGYGYAGRGGGRGVRDPSSYNSKG